MRCPNRCTRRQSLQQMSAATALALAPHVASGSGITNSGKIKIGQIGVGHAHASKLSVYRASADYEVVGIVEPDAQLRQRAMSQAAFRDMNWMTRQQLLNTPGLQAVLVETRVEDLLDAAEDCVKAGKHVHVDKPAGTSLSQWRRILELAEQQKLLVQMGYMYRYNPGVVLLRRFLKQDWLGEVFEVHTVMSKVIDQNERHNLARFPGGILFELGCHVLDLVIAILGEPIEVNPYSQRVAETDDKLLDNMLAVLRYPKALATVKSSAVEVEGFARRHLVVCGTEGTFHIQPLDNPSARLTLAKDREGYQRGVQELTFPKYVRYIDDAADMVRILRGEKPTDFPYQHDLLVQTTLLRACGLPAV